MKLFLVATTIVTLALTACSTRGPHEGVHRGSVVMKMPNGEAHLCLGNTEVKEGDKVNLIRHECRVKVNGKRSEGADSVCTPVNLGSGTVIKVYNTDYSVAKFPESLIFSEGDTVEKNLSQSN